MAAIQRGTTYEYKKAFTNNSKHFVGFDYTIINSEEDAKANNRDIIRIEPFTMKTASGNNYYSLTWTDVDIQVKYGSSVLVTKTCTRRFRMAGSSGTYGSFNTKYYFKQAPASSAGDTWSGSNPTQNAIGVNGRKVNGYKHINTLDYLGTHGDNYGLIVTVPHNEDGTPKGNITVTIGSNRSDGYGTDSTPCKPSGSFELPKIDRGTKIWVYNGSTWNKTAPVHLQGEASGEQHYIYKYNGSTWVKYFG